MKFLLLVASFVLLWACNSPVEALNPGGYAPTGKGDLQIGTVVGADPIADGVVALGFGYPEAVQAAAATGNKSVEAAVQWLLQQEEVERQIAQVSIT